MSPRYSIWVSLDKAKNETRYLFKDNCEDAKRDRKGANFGVGIPLLYKDGFFSMRDPHDAIIFCNYLNEEEGGAK